MKHSYILLLILSLGSFFPIQCALKNVFGQTPAQITVAIWNTVAQGATVKAAINEYFYQKEMKIVQQIKTAYGVSDYDLNQMQQKIKNLTQNDDLYQPSLAVSHDPDDHWIINEARECIAAYGMNPDCVIITDAPEIPCAQERVEITDTNSLVHYLDLNIAELESYSDQARIHIIKHEMSHLWYADHLRLILLCQLTSISAHDPLWIAFSKNLELRAEIMAESNGLNEAWDYYSYLSTLMLDETDDFIHPTGQKLFKAVARFVWYLKIEQSLIA